MAVRKVVIIEIDIFNHDLTQTENITYKEPVRLVIKKESLEETKRTFKLKKNKPTILFKNCVFESNISIGLDENVEEEILLSFDGCYIDSFDPSGLISYKVSLQITNSINDHFVSQNSRIKNITIINSFGTYFFTGTDKLKIFYNEESLFIREWYKKQKITKILSYKTNFYINSVASTKIIGNEVGEKEREKKLEFHDSLYFSSNEFDSKNKERRLKTLLSKKQKESLDINVNLEYSPPQETHTTIRNVLLKSLTLKGTVVGETLIEDTKINDIYIRNFSPKTSLILYNIKTIFGEGKFEIHNSNLDNTWFNSVSLKDYFVVFYRSSFINTKFTSTIFPSTKELIKSTSSVKNIHYPEEKPDKEIFYRNMYELFLELKQALEKRGNIFEAQKMKAISHSFLYKIENSKILNASFWNNKFILGLNRLSNFHGISALNAFLWALGFIILFHSLNILSFKSYTLGFNNWDGFKSIIWNNKRYIFAIANPTHKISSLAHSSEITGYTYMISFLSRIFVGYTYYQFIAAFRRFGK